VAQKNLPKRLSVVFMVLAIAIWLCPIATASVHALQVALYAAAFVWLAILVRRKRAALVALLAVPVLIAGLLFAPSKPVNQETLRDLYMRNLLRYEGSP